MPQWRDKFKDFASHESLATLTFDRRPAWVWSRDGRRLIWSNGTGLMRLGVTSFSDAAATDLDEDSPLRQDIASAAAKVGTAESMIMLRLPSGNQSLPSPCRCSRITASSGGVGLLVIVLDAGLDAKFETAINNEALELLFSDEKTLAFVDVDPYGVRRLNLEERTVEAEARVALDRLVPPRQVSVENNEVDTASLAATGLSLAKEALDISPPIGESTEEGVQEESLPAGNLRRPADAATVSYRARAHDHISSDIANSDSSTQSASRSLRDVDTKTELALIDAEPTSKRPVRFLWQTDASVRFLFVSNGLAQTLGRNADIVGETWNDVAGRMGLDPHGRISRSFRSHDTWSGLTAWWPVESGDRVPVEMTALPVYSLDRKFQGFRGFGVIRPGDALSQDQFETRFPSGAGAKLVKNENSEEDAKIIPIRPDVSSTTSHTSLSDKEQTAFEEIASALTSSDETDAAVYDDEAADKSAAVEAGTIWDDEIIGEDDRSGWEPVPTKEDLRSEKPVMPTARPLELPPLVSAPKENASEDVPVPSTAKELDLSEEIARLTDEAKILRAERDAALRQNSDLGSLLDLLPCGSLGLNRDGSIMTANAPAAALLMGPGEAVLGQNIADLISLEDASLVEETMKELALAASEGTIEESLSNHEQASILVSSRRSGDDLLMTLRTVKETDETGFIASLQDFSQWKRREGDLKAEADRAQETSNQKSDFLAWVSHEIRTPMSAIIGFAEVLVEERFGPLENKQYRNYARDIRSSGQHVLSLVNDLLDLSKIEAGYFEINVTRVAINDVIQECLTIMYPQAYGKQVVLRTSLSQLVPEILADKRTMRQIILNLMSNSIKYTGSNGQVVVSSKRDNDGRVIIEVRDTGEGMSAKDLRLAMEPFQQLGAYAHGAGTGLGLPLTKLLVEANDASFDLQSSEGEGTVATIVFSKSSVVEG